MPGTTTIYGQYYDMMTFYIGTRAWALAMFGLFAMMKGGEQLRFMVGFWMFNVMFSFQDFIGSFCYFETTDPGDMKKIMAMIFSFIHMVVSLVNVIMIHKQVEAGPAQAAMNQVKSQLDSMGINMGGMQMVNKV